jgi:predicted alpha/beta superfamily hydrolase
MKTKLAVFLFFIYVTTAFSQETETFVKEFQSDILNTTRLLKISIPKSYKDNPDRMYPLAIVLDSEYLFDIYVSNVKLYSNKDKAPEQIVVGIIQNQNKERYKDCSYDKVTSMPTEEGTKFYQFIRNEVLNYLDANYRISPFKTIVGNTITSNFINYFLLENKPVFSAFVNINPSYALDLNTFFVKKIPAIKEPTYYYVINGKYNSKKKQKLINDMNDLLSQSKNENFNYFYDEQNQSTKIASIGQGIARSLAFIFEQFSPISKEEYKNKIANMTPPEAIEYLEKKYVDIEYLFGTNIKIRERDIFAIEGIIIDKADGDYLEEFGKMINRLYPESPIGDYYIGKYYETGNDYKKALKYYKNGYAKIDGDDPNKDGYYQNVERVLALREAQKNPTEEDNENDDAKDSEDDLNDENSEENKEDNFPVEEEKPKNY